MLIAAQRENGVFNQAFLKNFHDLSLQSKQLQKHLLV